MFEDLSTPVKVGMLVGAAVGGQLLIGGCAYLGARAAVNGHYKKHHKNDKKNDNEKNGDNRDADFDRGDNDK